MTQGGKNQNFGQCSMCARSKNRVRTKSETQTESSRAKTPLGYQPSVFTGTGLVHKQQRSQEWEDVQKQELHSSSKISVGSKMITVGRFYVEEVHSLLRRKQTCGRGVFREYRITVNETLSLPPTFPLQIFPYSNGYQFIEDPSSLFLHGSKD